MFLHVCTPPQTTDNGSMRKPGNQIPYIWHRFTVRCNYSTHLQVALQILIAPSLRRIFWGRVAVRPVARNVEWNGTWNVERM